MTRKIAYLFALAFLVAPVAAQAAESTVVLSVHHAGCVLCGPIIKSTLSHVTGVRAVQVTQPDGMSDVTATVTFDDAQTTTAALIKATSEHGYPADVATTASKS